MNVYIETIIIFTKITRFIYYKIKELIIFIMYHYCQHLFKNNLHYFKEQG